MTTIIYVKRLDNAAIIATNSFALSLTQTLHHNLANIRKANSDRINVYICIRLSTQTPLEVFSFITLLPLHFIEAESRFISDKTAKSH